MIISNAVELKELAEEWFLCLSNDFARREGVALGSFRLQGCSGSWILLCWTSHVISRQVFPNRRTHMRTSLE